MITIIFDGDEHSVTVRGHAGYAERGRDIVCAGVSALTGALVDGAARYDGEVKIGTDGAVTVRCHPAPETVDECSAVMQTVLYGFWNIEREYPNHVKVQYIGGN